MISTNNNIIIIWDISDTTTIPTIHRTLQFRQTSRKPTTLEEKTYNAPSSGVAFQFISNEENGKQRLSAYKTNKDELQTVSELNAEYDLLGYPLYFPEGNKYKFGWCEKIDKGASAHTIIQSHILNSENETILENWNTIENSKIHYTTKLNKQLKLFNILYTSEVKLNDLQYLSSGIYRAISMKQFYHFLFQERANDPILMTRKMEKHEYKNKTITSKRRTKKEKLQLQNNDTKQYGNETIRTIFPHPESRFWHEQIPMPDGTTTIIPATRQPAKKNPLLYGDRLKLFYLCVRPYHNSMQTVII